MIAVMFVLFGFIRLAVAYANIDLAHKAGWQDTQSLLKLVA